ncbi:MAG TPA: hypothetical protein VIH59_20000 [Candidatus Tectomicrobia bacterium]
MDDLEGTDYAEYFECICGATLAPWEMWCRQCRTGVDDFPCREERYENMFDDPEALEDADDEQA